MATDDVGSVRSSLKIDRISAAVNGRACCLRSLASASIISASIAVFDFWDMLTLGISLACFFGGNAFGTVMLVARFRRPSFTFSDIDMGISKWSLFSLL